MSTSAEPIGQRVAAAERLCRIFLPERIGYLFVTLLSCGTLLVVIWRMVSTGKAGQVELTMMFGSSGLMTYSAGRVLKMFNDVLAMVAADRGQASISETATERGAP